MSSDKLPVTDNRIFGKIFQSIPGAHDDLRLHAREYTLRELRNDPFMDMYNDKTVLNRQFLSSLDTSSSYDPRVSTDVDRCSGMNLDEFDFEAYLMAADSKANLDSTTIMSLATAPASDRMTYQPQSQPTSL